MLKEQSKTSYEKLIEAIKIQNKKEALELIAEMDTTELSKIDSRGETALIYAIRQNMEKVCELLIPKMSDESINHGRTTYNDTALILAARKNMDKVCEMLIPKMSQLAINELNHNQDNALNAAAWHGLDKVCELLISKKIWISVFNCYGDTALTCAIEKGHEKICELLIPEMSQLGITHANNKNETALSLAQKKGFQNICDLLTWILHEGGIYKNKMAISLISGHGYVNFHLNYV